MQVKSGYKQTEIGVIPEDWRVEKFSDVTKLITCGLAATPTYVSQYSGKPFLSAQNVRKGKVVYDKHRYISEELFNQITKHNKPQRGDILYTRVGAGIGEAGVISDDYRFGIYVSLTLIKIDKHKADSHYFAHLLNSDNYRSLAKNGQFAGGGVQNLNVEVVRKFPVAVPTKAEQEAIAEALSDTDAWIESLEQLIAKKRHIKAGSMQALLTGKQRLPGFSGEWEENTLAEVGEVSSGGVDKKIQLNETPVRLLNYMDVYRKDFIKSTDLWHEVTAPTNKAKKCAIQKGDIFFTPSSEVREDIGHSAVALEDIPDACYSYHVVRLRPHKLWDLNFRAYVFKTKSFMDQASILCDGGGTRYVISQGKFRAMTVFVPTDPAEQTAIAAILSDMDSELDALESKLSKARQIKQGMMQELLTGKTRLV